MVSPYYVYIEVQTFGSCESRPPNGQLFGLYSMDIINHCMIVIVLYSGICDIMVPLIYYTQSSLHYADSIAKIQNQNLFTNTLILCLLEHNQ